MSETRARSGPDLVNDPVGPSLWRLALPMVAGILVINLFNIVDTWFIGQLGAEPLAAMAFTFPVTFVVTSMTMGIGVGASAVISRAIGEAHPERVRRLTTHALFLGVALVTAVSGIGLLTIEPLFTALGAEAGMMPLIEQYMRPIYFGLGFLVVPMIGNSAIRATGDTKTPSVIMMVAGGVNLVLDPLLIFGWGPFPRLELFGGALATVISWGLTFVAALYLLHRRERMLAVELPRPAAVWASWRAILYVGLPAAATFLLVPVANGILTRFVADHGPEAVAGYGVGGRVEALAMVAVYAIATGMAPFVGQNFGARHCGRIRQAVKLSVRFVLAWGVGMAALLALGGATIGGWFSDEAAVVEVTARYLLWVPLGYAGMGAAIVANTTFNALNLPLRSAAIVVIRLFVLALPLALIGESLYGLEGIFGGLALGNVLAGLVAYGFLFKILGVTEAELDAGAKPNPAEVHHPVPAPSA